MKLHVLFYSKKDYSTDGLDFRPNSAFLLPKNIFSSHVIISLELVLTSKSALLISIY